MRLKLKPFILFLLLLPFVIGCKESYEPDQLSVRTVLVYMVKSDLESNLQNNLEDMIAVATQANLRGGNLVVYYSGKNSETGIVEAELFQIKEGNGGVVTRHHLKDYTGESAISPDVMNKVIKDVFTTYPAESYGLILSSHGTSWLPSNYTRLRSFGEENSERMEVYDLAKGLRGFPLEFLLFDACSMAGIECLYELKDVADYIIASPSETMRYGFPYKIVLPMFFKDELPLDEIAYSFYNFYNTDPNVYPYGNISVTKTDELDQLAAITKEILSPGGEDVMFNLPLDQIQILSYISAASTKLYDFAEVIKRIATDEQYARFETALDKTVISKYSTDLTYLSGRRGTERIRNFSGVSVYPPQTRFPQLTDWYRTNLSWYKAVYP